jgi:hypothetical protein
MGRAVIGLLVMVGLAGLAGAVASGQTVPPPVHLPMVRLDETPTATATVSPTPTVFVGTPTAGPGGTPTVIVVPTPTPTAMQGPDGSCLCDRNRYNCSDFATQA